MKNRQTDKQTQTDTPRTVALLDELATWQADESTLDRLLAAFGDVSISAAAENCRDMAACVRHDLRASGVRASVIRTLGVQKEVA